MTKYSPSDTGAISKMVFKYNKICLCLSAQISSVQLFQYNIRQIHKALQVQIWRLKKNES